MLLKCSVDFIFIVITFCVSFTENIQMNKMWKSMHKCIRLWIYSAYVGVTTQNEDYLVYAVLLPFLLFTEKNFLLPDSIEKIILFQVFIFSHYVSLSIKLFYWLWIIKLLRIQKTFSSVDKLFYFYKHL